MAIRRPRVLVAYSTHGAHVPTTREYLNAYASFLEADVEYLHVTNELGADVDLEATLSDYDVIINNYCARHCFDGYVGRIFVDALKKYAGLKILVVQDEYQRTNFLKGRIREISFDVVLTNVAPKSLDYVYPRREFPNVRFETVLTGYVPDSLVDQPRESVPLDKRPLVVGYRGRNIGGLYGRLGFEKYEIGRRMRELCLERGIAHDIDMNEETRIYGPAWFDFIGSCRAMLGSESGSNVFDFDGSVERKFKELESAIGVPPSYADFAPYIGTRDCQISMGQVSPRVFECAVMRTPMILFCGNYSGAVAPEEHYIPLEKDFSNVDEVFDRLQDIESLQALAERSYQHLVASGKFGYRAYMKRIQGFIEEELDRPERSREVVQISPAGSVPDFLVERPTTHPKSRASIDKPQLLVILDEIERLTGLIAVTTNESLASCRFLKEDVEETIKSTSGATRNCGKRAALASFFSVLHANWRHPVAWYLRLTAANTLMRNIDGLVDFLQNFSTNIWVIDEKQDLPQILDAYKQRLAQIQNDYDHIYSTRNLLYRQRDELIQANRRALEDGAKASLASRLGIKR